MSFSSGPVTFRRYYVIGQCPTLIDQPFLDILNGLCQPDELAGSDEAVSNRGCDTTYGVLNERLCPDCVYEAYGEAVKNIHALADQVLARKLSAIAAVLDRHEGRSHGA